MTILLLQVLRKADLSLDMRDKKYFKITHDPKIYTCEYPVRVSVGGPKAEYILDYKGKD